MADQEAAEPKRRKLDLASFQPEAIKPDPEKKTVAAEIAAESGFTTRHHYDVNSHPHTPVLRRGRKKQTGRNTQFTVKLKPETNNAIYRLADRLDVNALAEVIELAIEALEAKIDRNRK